MFALNGCDYHYISFLHYTLKMLFCEVLDRTQMVEYILKRRMYLRVGACTTGLFLLNPSVF